MGRDWIILRTAGRSTLPLARSLAADGYEVWTPIETSRVRIPRANVRRVVHLPLLKGFVFAAYDRRHDLLRLSDNPGRHASFSILRNFGGIATVADSNLDGLRWVEARLNIPSKKMDRAIPDGVEVRVSSGLFGGMTGVVRRSKRGITLVCFNDRYSAEIPTSLLISDQAYRFSSATGGPAALAA